MKIPTTIALHNGKLNLKIRFHFVSTEWTFAIFVSSQTYAFFMYLCSLFFFRFLFFFGFVYLWLESKIERRINAYGHMYRAQSAHCTCYRHRWQFLVHLLAADIADSSRWYIFLFRSSSSRSWFCLAFHFTTFLWLANYYCGSCFSCKRGQLYMFIGIHSLHKWNAIPAAFVDLTRD